MIEIDGSQYSGSGTIVRQSAALAALTKQPVHVISARSRRLKPGLQPQHVRVIEAICELVNGHTDGAYHGSQEFSFWPGKIRAGARRLLWDIGSAGSTTLLTLAVLPVMAFAAEPLEAELRGGIFQDFAPSFFHIQQVMLGFLRSMGLEASIDMTRPGYVPRGGGILRLTTLPVSDCLQPLIYDGEQSAEVLWGISLASHLQLRAVARRMADAARNVLITRGYDTKIDIRDDMDAIQSGAALALFANLSSGCRLGADGAGAFRRPSEAIGKRVAAQLLEDLETGTALDRYAADQIIPFAALARGESRFRISKPSEHIVSNAWLVQEFLGARVEVKDHIMSVQGVGFRRGADLAA
jgi:RNA 3'-terminal phosphate cyclase (ATP)